MASAGSDQPITPVELGRICVGANPSAFPVATQIRSEASTPPGAHTLEILLLMITAASDGSASRLRPMITGAPGNALRVNIAANAVVGSSSTIIVSVILA